MSKQQKLITSHGFRVKRAKEYVKNSPEKISIIDREAIVEFYLLEDIQRLYVYRLNRAIQSPPRQTRDGAMSGASTQKILRSTLHLIQSAIEIAEDKINTGRYSDVWKAIPEGALMHAAGNLKYLEKMKEMLSELLGQLSPEALQAVQVVMKREEELDDIRDNEANYCEHFGISLEEFEAITNPSASSVTAAAVTPKSRLNPKIN